MVVVAVAVAAEYTELSVVVVVVVADVAEYTERLVVVAIQVASFVLDRDHWLRGFEEQGLLVQLPKLSTNRKDKSLIVS